MSTYYYYRELYDDHLFKDERKIVAETDYFVFNAVATFIDDLYDPTSHGKEQAAFLRGALEVVESLVTTFEVLVDSIENVIKQGAMKTDNSRNRIPFIKRLQSLITLNELNLQTNLAVEDFKAAYKIELDNYPREIKTMDGMKRFFAMFLVEINRAHKKWYGSPFIDFSYDEMFPKSSSIKNEPSKRKTVRFALDQEKEK